MLNQARGPVGILAVSNSSPDQSSKPNTAAPAQPLQHPSGGQAPPAWCACTGEPSRVPSCQCRVTGAHGKAAAPVPVACAQWAPCPWNSVMQQRTDGRARTPGQCVWHHSTVWPTLTPATEGSCPCGAPWHKPRAVPPGWAGPARACQAAGNRSGRSRWLHPEPAVLWAQGPRGHRACRDRGRP